MNYDEDGEGTGPVMMNFLFLVQDHCIFYQSTFGK